MTEDELLTLVVEQFESTGAETPGWANPRPNMEPPLEEEYSRLLDPGKYRIMRARVQAWHAVLASLGAVHVETVGDASVLHLRGMPAETAFRWTPTAPGALPVMVTYRSIDGVSDAVLEIGAGEPVRLLLAKPECGCDACDDGSEHLLEEIDGFFTMLVTGGLVRVELPDGYIQTRYNGWDAAGDSGAHIGADGGEQLLSDARSGRSPFDVLTGTPWL